MIALIYDPAGLICLYFKQCMNVDINNVYVIFMWIDLHSIWKFYVSTIINFIMVQILGLIKLISLLKQSFVVTCVGSTICHFERLRFDADDLDGQD